MCVGVRRSFLPPAPRRDCRRMGAAGINPGGFLFLHRLRGSNLRRAPEFSIREKRGGPRMQQNPGTRNLIDSADEFERRVLEELCEHVRRCEKEAPRPGERSWETSR
jgi:hypothetical protein